MFIIKETHRRNHNKQNTIHRKFPKKGTVGSTNIKSSASIICKDLRHSMLLKYTRSSFKKKKGGRSEEITGENHPLNIVAVHY